MRSALGVVAGLALLSSACNAPMEEVEDELDQQQLAENEQECATAGFTLFTTAKFGGNGRTCATCHTLTTGTLNPAQIALLGNSSPLFRPIDSNDGVGNDYSRLKAEATIRVAVKLAPNWRVTGSTSSKATFNRGIPTFFNSALEPKLMIDGRERTLKGQALSAIKDHFQPKIAPTDKELERIACYERSVFSSLALKRFASGGSAPTLPAGVTASEKRGRAFFLGDGLCGMCHGGPMLNTETATAVNFGFGPAGSRFDNVLISEFNMTNQPMINWTVKLPDGSEVTGDSPDVGRAAVTGRVEDFNRFKISTLWGVSRTAPYFHDNSAKTLTDVVNHYDTLFQLFEITALTAQQKADIVAYMKLL